MKLNNPEQLASHQLSLHFNIVFTDKLNLEAYSLSECKGYSGRLCLTFFINSLIVLAYFYVHVLVAINKKSRFGHIFA
jgi:hypothetical protein